MTAFARAIAALHADPNLAAAAEWQAATGGTWVALRLIPSLPEALVPGAPGAGVRAVAVLASIPASDLPQPPRRGDLLRWGSPMVTYRVETVETDALGVSHHVGLSRA